MPNRLLLLCSAVLFSFAACQPEKECGGCVSGDDCIPVNVSVSSAAACGLGGAVCAVCEQGDVCQNGACVASTGTGGGTATTGGGNGVTGGGNGTTGGGSGVTGGGDGSTGGGDGSTGGGTGVTGGGTGVTGGGTGVTGGGTAVTGGGTAVTGGGTGVTGGGTAVTGGGTGVTGGGTAVTGGGTGVTGGGTGVTGGGTGGGTGSPGCSSGTTVCGGRCVNLQLDAANCNACGNVCASGQSCQAGSCVSAAASGIVFSEVNPGLNTIELFNGSASTVNLQNYTLQWTLGDGGSGSVALPTYPLPAQGFVVLGNGSADAGYLNSVNFNIKSTDWALRLLSPGGAGVDFIRTGSSTVPPATGDSFVDAGLNPTLATYQSLVRNVFAADSNSPAEWSLAPNASPGRVCARPGLCGTNCIDLENDRNNCGGCGNACTNAQVCRSGTCVAGAATLGSGELPLLISEYRMSPIPMVELYNPGSAAITLDGYKVQVAAIGTFLFTFPPNSGSLAPGKFITVHGITGNNDFNSVYPPSPAPTNSFTGSAAITVFHDTVPVDFVRFGSSTATAPTGLYWFTPNITYPVVAFADASLHRKLDVLDTDSANDWVSYNPSTPGFACQAGLTLCGGVCVNLSSDATHCGGCGSVCEGPQVCLSGTCASVGGVVLSRLSNVSPESIEIYNGGTTPVALDGYSLSWTADSNTDSFTFSADAGLAPGAYLQLVEGTGTSTATKLFTGKSIVWSTHIAVNIKNAAGTAIDFVRTAGSTALPETGTFWMGANAANPSDSIAAETLSREVRLADTNTAADWKLSTIPAGNLCGPDAAEGEPTSCGLQCTNTLIDPQNCGACGNVCAFACSQGQCSRNSIVPENGVVRLTSNGGPLQFYYGGSWRYLYYGSWTSNAATIACRSLGYSGYSSYSSTTSYYGDYFTFSGCTGTESSLSDCAVYSQSNYSYALTLSCTP